jgi:alkyl sulfatase BDS1-like metallo-beta-lactamase superfamily hydrolase
VRQIHNGLRGWFDGDEAKLFPLATAQRHARLISELGGRGAVRDKVRAAINGDDLRWATELATWLVRSNDADDVDRGLLASCLRVIAERTPSANVRNWCVTRARHLDRSGPLDPMYKHRFNERATGSLSTIEILGTLRVLVDPDAALGVDDAVCMNVDGEQVVLHIRNCVSVVNSSKAPVATLSLTRDVLNQLLSNKLAVSIALERGDVTLDGDRAAALNLLAIYEVDGFRS